MDVNMILEIIRLAGYVVLGGLVVYFKYNSKLSASVTKFIVRAENEFKDTVKAGGLKQQLVIDKLYELIPSPLNVFFTKEMVANIVQRTFDEVEQYAKTQLDKVVDKVANDEPK